jgi:hypothetical protein
VRDDRSMPAPTDPAFHLAQINIGRLRAPTDDPLVAEFMDALDEINALAEASPGFVWRFQTEDGNATAVRPYEDELVLINMSLWESVQALGDYVYRSDHVTYLRRRAEWFHRTVEAIVALWWVPAGTLPAVEDGVARVEHVRRHGPTPYAFTFRHTFAPSGAAAPSDDRDTCPA